jgi:PII-like signaling protein
MNMQPVTVARVYTMEGHDQLNQALDILHDEQKIVGVTLIRGIAGYGDDREVHTSSILSLSLELPLVIEFYDEPEKVKIAIKALQSRLDLKHIVTWSAMAFLDASV